MVQISGTIIVIQQLAKSDSNIVTYSFEQNVGQHRAVLKGIEMSRGDKVVIMDADLQDSPAMIPLFMKKLNQGYEAVFAERRGKYESPFRLLTSKIFKFLMHQICKSPKDAGMFVAMTHPMLEALENISMSTPFVVAMIGLTGLKTSSIPFSRDKPHQGKTSYTSLMRLSISISALYQVIRFRCKNQYANQQKK